MLPLGYGLLPSGSSRSRVGRLPSERGYAVAQNGRPNCCAADERQALQQQCRYITPPALAYGRVQTGATGQVVAEDQDPWRDGTAHLVMSPLEFMQRLAALVSQLRLHPQVTVSRKSI
jgi:hypothetical protein